METFCRPPALISPFISPKTLTLAPRKTLISIRASQTPNPSPAKTLISSIAKPALIALTAAAAVFLSSRSKPSLAAAAPAAVQTETLADEQAARSLESHLRSNPNDVSSLRSLMELKVKSGNIPEAIAIVDRLVSLEPGEDDLPILRAHLQSFGGELDAARAGFEDIIAKDLLAVEAYHGLVMLASQSEEDGELDEIMRRVEAAMEVCTKEKRTAELKDFKLLVAQVRIIEERYAEALKIYEELMKEDPSDFRPYLCQGIIYTLMNKKDEAERQFKEFRKLVPKEHPYAQFLDHNMDAMRVFSSMEYGGRCP